MPNTSFSSNNKAYFIHQIWWKRILIQFFESLQKCSCFQLNSLNLVRKLINLSTFLICNAYQAWKSTCTVVSVKLQDIQEKLAIKAILTQQIKETLKGAMSWYME